MTRNKWIKVIAIIVVAIVIGILLILNAAQGGSEEVNTGGTTGTSASAATTVGVASTGTEISWGIIMSFVGPVLALALIISVVVSIGGTRKRAREARTAGTPAAAEDAAEAAETRQGIVRTYWLAAVFWAVALGTIYFHPERKVRWETWQTWWDEGWFSFFVLLVGWAAFSLHFRRAGIWLNSITILLALLLSSQPVQTRWEAAKVADARVEAIERARLAEPKWVMVVYDEDGEMMTRHKIEHMEGGRRNLSFQYLTPKGRGYVEISGPASSMSGDWREPGGWGNMVLERRAGGQDYVGHWRTDESVAGNQVSNGAIQILRQ
ncbi:MAG: hypothetical protein U9M92_02335 [Patescibacteria group bacterium]|nr:hypothetical protein [Patescibacteria group bacterium]